MSRTPAAVLLLLIAGCASAPLTPDESASLDLELKKRPDWTAGHVARANLLLAADRRTEALESFDRALAIEPLHLDALTARGVLLADLGRSADAERDFNAVVDAAPQAPDGYLLRAWLERGAGRFSEAARDLAEARSRDPGRWEAYYNAGVAASKAGRWRVAERNFELSLLLRPDHADGWIARSRAHAALGRTDRAIEDLDRAARERPDDAGIWYARGELLRSTDRASEAVRAYDRAIELDPVAEIYAGRAQARVALNDPQGADADFARALELDPGLRTAWLARARWRAAELRFEGARDDYLAALRLRATASVLRELARLYHDREQWDPAVAGYETALRICVEPDLRPVLERDLADARARKK